MSVLHSIYRVDILSPTAQELPQIINQLYLGNFNQFFTSLRRNINDLLTIIPGTTLQVIGSGVLSRNSHQEIHIWGWKGGDQLKNDDIAGLVRNFTIEPRFEFAVPTSVGTQRYKIPFRLGFTLQNLYLDVEHSVNLS